MMKIKHYYLEAEINKPHKIALVADLHDRPYEKILNSLCIEKPDFIVINGDLLYAVIPGHSIYEHLPESRQHFRYTCYAKNFLKQAVEIATVLFSTGNHELYLDNKDKTLLKRLGIIFLDNEYIDMNGLVFGGLSSPYHVLAGTGNAKRPEDHERRWKMIFDSFDYSWLPDFCNQKGFKILLSHHPEIYEQHLKKLNGIDLILSGHAHGGQIRLFGHGLYAYGQGWFPKYTGGMYDGKLIVSRGLSNTSRIPRIGNPTELVYIDLIPIK